MDRASPRSIISIKSDGESGIAFEARGFRWQQLDSKDTLVADSRFITAPPVFDLAPGGNQILRVGLRSASTSPVEESYRVIVSELPDERPEAAGVRVLMRMSLPVFITPKGAVAMPVISANIDTQGAIEMTIHNRGTANLRLTHFSVYAQGSADQLLVAVTVNDVEVSNFAVIKISGQDRLAARVEDLDDWRFPPREFLRKGRRNTGLS